jgi:hypothetical protein
MILFDPATARPRIIRRRIARVNGDQQRVASMERTTAKAREDGLSDDGGLSGPLYSVLHPPSDADWLKSKWLLIDAERQKIFECGKARGYKRLS